VDDFDDNGSGARSSAHRCYGISRPLRTFTNQVVTKDRKTKFDKNDMTNTYKHHGDNQRESKT